jgi:hypothetical protein
VLKDPGENPVIMGNRVNQEKREKQETKAQWEILVQKV